MNEVKRNDTKCYEAAKKNVVNKGMSYSEYEKAIKDMCKKCKF